MAEPRQKREMFNFEVPKGFNETFHKFQLLAGEGERSTSALLRILIKKYVEEKEGQSR